MSFECRIISPNKGDRAYIQGLRLKWMARAGQMALIRLIRKRGVVRGSLSSYYC